MTCWRRRWKCKGCGFVLVRMLSQRPNPHTPCPRCGGHGWRSIGVRKLVCSVEGCAEDARSSGFCLRHEREMRKNGGNT